MITIVKKTFSKKTILQTVAFVWIIVILAIFWLDINKDATNCGLKQGCFSLFGNHWQIILQDGHKFYIDVIASIANSVIQKPHTPAPVLLIFGVIFFIYFANFFYDRVIQKKKELNLSFTPFALVLVFTGIFALSFNRWVTFFFLNKPITSQSIWLRYPLIVIQSLAIVLVVLSVGLKLKSLLLKEQSKEDGDNIARNFILSFSMGLIAVVFPLYILGLFKILLFKYVVSLFIILLIIARKEAFFWIKVFFVRKFEFRGSFLDPSIFLILISLTFMANNLIELIRPYPMGFDDLMVYINNPNLMAKSGSLISGAMSYYWELFVSLGFILYKQTEMALTISFIGGIVAFISIYYVINIYCHEKGLSAKSQRTYASLVATLFYTFPAIVFQSAKDVKVDMGALAVTLAAFILFWEWRKKVLHSETNKTYFRLLVIVAVLTGFAFAIKYTNALFTSILMIYVFWTMIEAKSTIFRATVICAYFGMVSLIPVMPITLRNLFQTSSVSVASLRFGDQSPQEIKINPPFDNGDYITNQRKYMREKATAPREELGRFTGYDPFVKKYLKLPLGILQNSFISGTFVDFGYLIPVFAPIILLLIGRAKKQEIGSHNNTIQLTTLTFAFWLMWLFSASGVIWYGYSGLIFILLLFVESNIQIRRYFSRWFIFMVNALIIIWLMIATCTRLGFLANINLGIEQVGLSYARGNTTAEEYVGLKFNPYLQIVDDINKEIELNPSNPPKIYMIGSFYKYAFERNDKTVLYDQLFDIFMFSNQDKDQQKTIQRIKNSGFDYILFDKNSGALKTPDGSVAKKYNDFADFMNQNHENFELLSDPYDTRYIFVKIK